jgi:putative transcriptional regulator
MVWLIGRRKMIAKGTFGHAIRNRRRQLKIKQKDVARQIGATASYIGHLESGRRHPSQTIVSKLAEVLGLPSRELFFIANPRTKLLVSQKPKSPERSAWDAFVRDKTVRKVHNITDQEMTTLEAVASLGDIRSPGDFIYILNAIRQALGK